MHIGFPLMMMMIPINEYENMRIDELTGYKSLPAVDQFISLVTQYSRSVGVGKMGQILKHAGYRVETGSRGLMFQLPKNQGKYVFKAWGKDSGYVYAVKIFKQHQNNPHIPKILRGPFALDNNKQFWVIVLEELEPIHDEDLRKFIIFVADVFENLHQLSTKQVITLIENNIDKIGLTHSIKYYADILKTFWPTLLMFEEGDKNFLDLGNDNVMIRPSDNQLVITDPVAGF